MNTHIQNAAQKQLEGNKLQEDAEKMMAAVS